MEEIHIGNGPVACYGALAVTRFKKCNKAECVTDAPMPKSAFLTIFSASLKNVGYLVGGPQFTPYGGS